MYEIFNINTDKIFKIEPCVLNKPVNIKTLDDHYLSCHEFENVVDFYQMDDNSGRQKWIIEKSKTQKNIVYIRCAFNRYNHTNYLGCPNENNQVFLYTSKNQFTRWSIRRLSSGLYNIKYIGKKFNKNNLTVVVARYNEDVEWALAYNDVVTLYNKGQPINLNFNTVFDIVNIGREGHTYLYHIINNYDNLTKKTIFLQGEPFPHNETVLFGVDNYKKTLEVQPLSEGYMKSMNIPTNAIIKKFGTTTDYGLKYLVLEIDDNFYYFDYNNFYDPGLYPIIEGCRKDYPGPGSIVEKFLNRCKFEIKKPINVIRFTWAGLFSLSKNSILNHDIDVYKRMISELTSLSKNGGMNGFILERLWLYIFEY